MSWGSPIELETKRRINVAVWAFAYEFLNTSLVSDADFDAECLLVDLSIKTSNPKMDRWFKKHFAPFTGQWVHKHPGKKRLEDIAMQRIIEQVNQEK